MSNCCKRCTQCCLPTNFPGVTFDDRGVCNLCEAFDLDDHSENIFSAKRQLNETVCEVKRLAAVSGSTYDVIVALSGGKD